VNIYAPKGQVGQPRKARQVLETHRLDTVRALRECGSCMSASSEHAANLLLKWVLEASPPPPTATTDVGWRLRFGLTADRGTTVPEGPAGDRGEESGDETPVIGTPFTGRRATGDLTERSVKTGVPACASIDTRPGRGYRQDRSAPHYVIAGLTATRSTLRGPSVETRMGPPSAGS